MQELSKLSHLLSPEKGTAGGATASPKNSSTSLGSFCLQQRWCLNQNENKIKYWNSKHKLWLKQVLHFRNYVFIFILDWHWLNYSWHLLWVKMRWPIFQVWDCFEVEDDKTMINIHCCPHCLLTFWILI
jgi:hypothetical protein